MKTMKMDNENFVCINKGISSFEHLPNGVVSVNCYENFISSFEHLPESVEQIICGKNLFTDFKFLPTNIKHLDCQHCDIRSFEYLPSNLESINVCRNPIHRLYVKFDRRGENLELVYLLQALKLDYNIHKREDIHPILNLLSKENYRELRFILLTNNITLKTHSTNEILNILTSL